MISIKLNRMAISRLLCCTALLGMMTLPIAGCHSAHIDALITNASGGTISLVEVDYPSASFGKEALPIGATYKYRFKVLGDGPCKVLWTDAARQEHTVVGPVLSESSNGWLSIEISNTTAEIHFMPAT